MRAKRLGEVLQVQSGFAFKTEFFSESEGIPLIRIRDLPNTSTEIRYKGDYRPEFLVNKGDYLIGMDGNFRCFQWEGSQGLLNQRVCRLHRFSDEVEPDYVYYGIRRKLLEIENATSFATVKHISAKQIESIELPLPPLAQQHRVADILSRAEGILRLQYQAAEKAREIIPALFLDMFGDPATNPMGWPMVEVGQFVSRFQGGKNFRAAGSEEEAGRFRILKVSAVTYGVFKPEESKPVPRDYLPPSDHLVRAGDLLFSRANTVELVGATAYVSSTPNDIILPDKLWRFIWNRAFKTEPLFVWALFQAPAIRRDLGRLATGTSGSMKNISQAKLLCLRVPMPPYTAQRSFADRLEACLPIQAGSIVATQHSETLFQSLLHRAFSGGL